MGLTKTKARKGNYYQVEHPEHPILVVRAKSKSKARSKAIQHWIEENMKILRKAFGFRTNPPQYQSLRMEITPKVRLHSKG